MEIGKVTDLPTGWTAMQAGGTFRLSRARSAFFGFAVGQQAWKQFLLPPDRPVEAHRQGSGWRVNPQSEAVPKFAFLGVRSVNLRMAVRTGFSCRAPM